MSDDLKAPTDCRFLTSPEWNTVTGVFGSSNLPFQHRILLTNGQGGGGAPFTIPTAAISLMSIPALAQDAISALIQSKLGSFGTTLSKIANFTGFTGPGATLSQVLGIFNIGYLMNVGPDAFPNMMASPSTRNTLVHEMTHVWQGKANNSSVTYMHNSVMNQCRCARSGGSRSGAYDYTLGNNWSGFGAEGQAQLVEDWYIADCPESGDLWPYIRDKVRKGIP